MDDAAAIVKGNQLTQEFRIFEKEKDDMYRMHRYFIVERIFSPSRVEKALKESSESSQEFPSNFLLGKLRSMPQGYCMSCEKIKEI